MRTFILWFTTALVPLAVVLAVRFHLAWLLLALPPLILWIVASLRPNLGWWGPVMRIFPTRKREALLTFDHSPDPLETTVVLDVLDEQRAHALFFLTGVKALRHPELVREIVQRGHAIGIHGMSFDPGNAWWWPPGRVRSEVDTAMRVVEQILPGYAVQWFRAPGGHHGPWLHAVLDVHGLQLMGCSAQDGDRDFERTVIALRRDIDQGGIISLRHGRRDREGEPLLPDLVREIASWLRGQGYKLGED